ACRPLRIRRAQLSRRLSTARAAKTRPIGDRSMTNARIETDAKSDMRRDAPGLPTPTGQRPAPEPVEDDLRLPEGCIPILPVRDTLLFPATVLPLDAGAPQAAAAVQYAVKNQ